MAEKVYLSFKGLDVYKLINLETCTQDGVCSYSCPAYAVTHENYSVPAWKGVEFRKLLNRQRGIRSILLGRRPVPKEWLSNLASKGLYSCCLCGRCMPGCVFTIQNLELWETLRSIIYEAGEASPKLMELDGSLEKNMNPYHHEHINRMSWIKELGPKDVKEGERAKTLYYVGCTSAYQEKKIASSTATVLNKMNEDWSLFGKDEWCCGDPHLAIGNHDKAKDYAKHNIEVASSLGANRIITGCAHCYRMWKWKYPELSSHNIEILHTSEYIKECMDSGKMKLEGKIPNKTTYHDPCYLSRLGGVIHEPRKVLSKISQNFIEIKEREFDTFCCGGGAMTEVVNEELWAKIGNERLNQAAITNSDLLISGCPFCHRSFIKASERSGSKMQILDITELVAQQLKD